MNNFFFNKYINQEHRDAHKKLHHGACKLGPNEGVGIACFHALADDVEGGKRHGSQDGITNHQGGHIVGRVLAVQVKNKTGK